MNAKQDTVTELVKEINERLKLPLRIAGQGHFDYNGKTYHEESIIESFKRSVEWWGTGGFVFHDSVWTKNGNNFIYQPVSFTEIDSHCSKCSQKITKWIISENTMEPESSPSLPCPITNTDTIESTLNLTSHLEFFNYFASDMIPANLRRTTYSLNYISGILNHTREYEKHNILFGQDVNSVYVFKHKEKDQVTLLAYGPDFLIELESELEETLPEDTEDVLRITKEIQELRKLQSDSEFVGFLSCDVWSYRATDSNTLKELVSKKTVSLPEGAKKVVVKGLTAGAYSLTHYQETCETRPFGLIAEITKK